MIFVFYFMSLISTHKITMSNHPVITFLINQLNRDIRDWIDRSKIGGKFSRAEFHRGFKFSFGDETGIAKLGLTSPDIVGIIEKLDYIVRDYTIELVNGERILTLHFSDYR